MPDNFEQYFKMYKNEILEQLRFSKINVPYFTKKFRNLNLSQITTYKDFVKFIPVTNSSEVTKNPKLFSSNKKIEFIRKSSSTTGKAKQVFLTKHDIHHWILNGSLTLTPYFKPGMILAHSKRKEKFYLSGLDKTVIESGGKILSFDPRDFRQLKYSLENADIILDYAEMIYYISSLVDKMAIKRKKKLILSYTGNKFEKVDIINIKNNFKKAKVDVNIFSEYSTTEIGPMGCSDSKNQNLFSLIYDKLVFFEIVMPGTNQPSIEGNVVVTALGRTGSNFIRYDVGDYGKLIFKSKKPLLKLIRRNTGLKIASIFFSPEIVFREIRRLAKVPVYCDINANEKEYFFNIDILVLYEKKINTNHNILIKKLAENLEFIDDLGTTVNLKVNMNKTKLSDSQIRKGYRFTYIAKSPQ